MIGKDGQNHLTPIIYIPIIYRAKKKILTTY